MDIIISANDKIKRAIWEMTLGDDDKINAEDFYEMMLEIAQEKRKNAVQKISV